MVEVALWVCRVAGSTPVHLTKGGMDYFLFGSNPPHLRLYSLMVEQDTVNVKAKVRFFLRT